ncbi:MAG: glycoside hydrolase family 9 protein, partial [Terriglobales bacterium]
MSFCPRLTIPLRLLFAAIVLLAALSSFQSARAQSAYVRVSQAGYEAGQTPFRAYLMSTVPVSGATFTVVNSSGATAFSGHVGVLLGKWSHSKTVTFNVYVLNFTVPAGDLYTISVSGPAAATSPHFAVDSSDALYAGPLLNTLFFYETMRDGANFIPNALRTAPGHLKDDNASVYLTPPLDSDDNVDNVPPAQPLASANLPNVNAAGGWWDAGDYMKYVETVSYTAALMQIGVRDFPNQMGAQAPSNPPAPPGSISYAGTSGPGAPSSSDFTAEAQFGVNWLLQMWNGQTKMLYYQVDNSQDWDYYGEGNPSSATGICGGTYATPYCLISEYDIWTLPQAADNFQQAGDPEPCDPYTTYFICNRPVFVAGPAGSAISPNLAGRLAADFALCHQLNQTTNPTLAKQCLKNAEDIFALANTAFPDPAPTVDSGTCTNCLLTTTPFDGYPENVWEDDMELGATELYFALQSAAKANDRPADLPNADPMVYLRQAAQFAKNYIKNIYDTGNTDTLNLYDVSGLAHFELYRALEMAGNPTGLAVSQASIRQQFLRQVNDAIHHAAKDPWGFGYQW